MGTGNSSKDILGLGAAVDDGTNTASYGGLTRATYTPNWSSTVTASSGTLTLAKLFTLYYNIASGNQVPTIAFCPEAVFTLYEQLLSPQERYIMTSSDMMKGSMRGTGALKLAIKGLPIMADEKATTGVFEYLNEDYIDWYGIDAAKAGAMFPGFEPVNYMPSQMEGNDYDGPKVKGLGFGWTDWIRASNALALVAHTVLGGQLINREPRFSGKLTGITSI